MERPPHTRDRTPAGGRIEGLDIARGVAILGTLGTNIWIFADPQGAFGWLAASTRSPDSAGDVVEAALLFLTNGKFLALLSIMFGVGLELQYQSARRRRQRWPGRYLWRSALLLVEGTLHYLLIFEFDVLMGYALVSVHVAFLVTRSQRVRRWWMIGAGALHVGVIGLGTLAMHTGNMRLSTPGAAATTLYTEGSWAEQVLARLTAFGAFRTEVLILIPLGTVLFLAGVALTRAGAFADSERGATLRSRMIGYGLGIGLPLNLLTSVSGPEWFLVDRYVLPPVVAFGLLGAVVTLTYRWCGPEPGALRRGLTATGRAAMSCYVFQNLVCGALCYGWGLGLAASLSDARPWWVIVAWAAIVALFMTLSVWWLRRFSRGPLELVLHWAYLAPRRSADRRGAGSGER
ncbi:DUF418 domain-containing protein [Halostreptopolyspora alba]|uniref:DUF418 domain-containing protein n=1 Tax=Halostreptopolyspora alba TaxID=2487137 RepID=A0A3N0E2S4_9ACTN|nr:DUF418 domain-containing protein [Nocardiopsaceae bacterium YIM 96095]